MKVSDILFRVGVGAVYVFLLLPLVIIVLASINSAEYLSFPPAGFSLRWYAAFFASPAFTNSLGLSVIVGVAAAALATAIGAPAAIFYVRHMKRGSEQFRMAVLAPLILPEVLTAIALLFFFNQVYSGTRTIAPLIIGHTVITLPFVFLSVSSALYNMPPAVEEAARTLGASNFTIFRRIMFPLIKSGVMTGAMLAFIISFDDVNVSLLLKPVGSATLPIQLYDYLRYDFDPTAAAASAISVLVTLVVVLVIDRLYGLRTVRF